MFDQLFFRSDAFTRQLPRSGHGDWVRSIPIHFRVIADEGIQRLQLAVCGENWIEEWISSVSKTDTDFDADSQVRPLQG
jgi:hypothetical protein